MFTSIVTLLLVLNAPLIVTVWSAAPLNVVVTAAAGVRFNVAPARPERLKRRAALQPFGDTAPGSGNDPVLHGRIGHTVADHGLHHPQAGLRRWLTNGRGAQTE